MRIKIIKKIIIFFLMLSVVILNILTQAAQAECDRQVVIKVPVNVYENTPQYSTGKGWVLAKSIGTLPKGTTIWICKEQSVGLLLSQKRWLQIRFMKDGKEHFGWIPEEGLKNSSGIHTDSIKLALFKIAYAQEKADIPEAGVPSPLPIYLIMFIAICFGMVAKGLFDRLEQRTFAFSAYMKKTIRAILVSPIVFMSMASAGDFSIQSTGSLLIFLCMAFQNGFFWQTVLVKTGGAKS